MIDFIENFFGVRIWWPLPLSLILAGGVYAILDKFLFLEPAIARAFASLANAKGGRPVDTYLSLLDRILDWGHWLLNSGKYRTSESRTRNLVSIASRFLAISLGYTTGLFILSWLASGNGTLGSLSVLPNGLTLSGRLAVVGFITLAVLGGFFGIVYHAKFALLYQKLPLIGEAISFNLISAIIASVSVGLSVYATTDRLDPALTLGGVSLLSYAALGAALLTFLGVFFVVWCFMALCISLAAAFCLYFGVPFLVGVPIVLAVIVFDLGQRPALLAVLLVPVSIAIIGPMVDLTTQLGAILVAGVLCFPFCVMVFSAHYRPRRGEKGKSFTMALLLAVLAYASVSAAVGLNSNQLNQDYVDSVFVLWFFFPLLNGFWDLISVLITFLLLNDLRRSLERFGGLEYSQDTPEEIGSTISRYIKSVFTFVWHFAFDLGFAFLILGLLVASLASGSSLLDMIGSLLTSLQTFDTDQLVNTFVGDPFSSDGWFVSLLLMSTVVPTCLHIIVVVLSIFVISFTPRPVTEGLQLLQDEKTEGDDFARSRASNRVSIYFSFGVFLSSIVSFGLIDYLAFALLDEGMLRFFQILI